MPNYRVEISPNARAGCQDAVCKAQKDKIKKGEIRLGVWVDYNKSDIPSGWKWRHWGCTSGEIIKHIQGHLDPDETGDYDWDRLDGWEEIVDNKEASDKVQRVIQQGHIDPEDFRGDPEFNKPGQKGIRGRAPRKKKNTDDDEAAPEPDIPKQAAKRGRKNVKEEDEDEPPAKKTKKSAVKKVVKDEHSDEDAKTLDDIPASKAKGKRGAAKKAAAVKDESDAEEPAQKVSTRPKRGAGKKAAVYKEEDESEVDEPEPLKKTSAAAKKRGAKNPVKEEVVSEEDELREGETPKKKTAAAKGKGKRGAAKKATTPEISESEPEFESRQADEESEENSEPEEPVVKSKRGRASKPAKAKRGRKA